MEEKTGYQVIRHSFDKIIHDLEREDMVQRDRGTLFELLVTAYLKNEPMYARLFDEVWMLGEVPEQYGIPKKDTGVDLVARNRETGELIAIQCKYYSKDTTIQKSHIDSFLNEVGKSYYAEGIIVTSTDKWSGNANDALLNRDKHIARIGLSQLRDSEIDWSQFSAEKPKTIELKSAKQPRSHQIPAIEAVVQGFETVDRGKLIMAPGTGKTYTSMVIAEKMAEKTEGTFRVLYLVPSIQLLSQSLRGWTADSKYRENMDTFAVCSDRKVTKKIKGENDFEDIAAADLGYPATTDYHKLLERQLVIDSSDSQSKFLVVFSTYQSIDVISEAQKNGFYEFDLIVCDEAHRTTGATEVGKEDSAFVKVHSDNNIKAKKRLYQTATPRIYGEDAKQKADEMSVVIADMNDKEIYGEEFYRIGFGDAVNKGILTDYKVMVLAVDEEVIARRFQTMLANKRDTELEFDDVTKIIGCWNGLIKRKSNSNIISANPMKRAIAFAGTIRESKLIKEMFTEVVDMYINESGDQTETVRVEIDHADGSMNALQKNEKISWLKADVPQNTCRILSNARFLTEGVDVPDLDAVMFLKPRKSRIDIAQAVGRVMRKAEGKDYGYVILPIGIPAGVDENSVLNKNEKYQVVWDVLNALRSIDERFDATINKLELNKKKPEQLQVVGVGSAPDESEGGFTVAEPGTEQLAFGLDEEEFSDIERAIYGKIVKKVGNVRYWEDWSKDVAEIAQQHMMRIRVMLEDPNSEAYKAFQKFVSGLRHNINGAISDQQAIEMLAQHLITKPVFEALFDSYSFANDNPVSRAMDAVLKVLDEQGLVKEQDRLEDFYESVRVRAEGIDNLKAKQDIIIQLYDKFFKVGFKETTERLGIVFTPVEVVDFIIHSVDDVLKKHFGKSISDEGVHILDPFTGTGTFIVRLLQSGLISKEDLLRKYTQELHANEIVLLSYYIAAINIEETFHSIMESDYQPFEGIVLTDTFESTEKENSFEDELFGENNERLEKQRKEPIFAIIGNPPYSIGQTNANDNNQNQSYPRLDNSIDLTYAKYSSANLKKSLYDSYIKAFRWSSDRIENKGVIGFVTNGSFIDSNSTDGLRKCWHDEFNYIYVFNLRGDQRTLGEKSRQEGGKIFGSGSRTPIAITLLVKDGTDNHEVYYHDIGDYLSREEKLSIISDLTSVRGIEWTEIHPDANNDWINQRDQNYDKYDAMDGGVFINKAIGVSTNRDAWVYGYNKYNVMQNTQRMVANYNSEVVRLSSVGDEKEKINKVNSADEFVKWTRGLKQKLAKSEQISLSNNVIQSMYRPYVLKWLYYDKNVVEMPGRYHSLFGSENKVIYVTGAGASRDFSCLIVDKIPNLDLMEKGQGFYRNDNSLTDALFVDASNINDSFKKKLGLSDDDVFNYVYGVLHSKEYRAKYANDLKKTLPRIPILKNKDQYVEIGRKLADLHLKYETVEPYSEIVIEGKATPSYKVTRMKHPKKGVKDKIVFNTDITITNIPEKAYEYVVNGRSAIEWIIDQYQVKSDKKSGIVDDPNLYSDDERYIFDLLLRIINVSVQTVDLVNSLPPLEIVDVDIK
ncbi:DEAD/DEAH box helicase family protein [Bacillus cereus]|uniref:DEAD/DEAH box helicase n=1 Tax=Bacillus TaxID=1386 RepID=UPI000890022E|nr:MULTISPECIES: type ISP restriction/modification enzyme [Bacillus]ASK17188.1 helicase [Bacillus cereus]MBL3785006.1 DEAD/DEAH box helicase [Bacillus cereus]MBL3798094.1 DEAD/DEAH box helicase [Bacillus cereus]MBL3816965.1 DEAD/DEAH box helicase [Bacillus cereus]MDZ4433127.1 DEAD/DEAH box helicase family protein [Bacillus cereus]